MTGTNGIGLRGLLVLALVLGFSAHASAGHRPVEISGTLQVGWAFGEIVSIGDHPMMGITGPMADATRAASGLKVDLAGVWRVGTSLHVTRIALTGLDEGPVRLVGPLNRDEAGTLAVGTTALTPSGPLAKSLERCVGLDITVTGEADPAGALNVRSIETPLPEGWPWLF